MLNEGRYGTTLPTLINEQKPDFWPVGSNGIPLVAFNSAQSTSASVGPVPTGATVVTSSSGNVAAAAATATLGAVASVLNYITGFEITGAGATAASVILVTVTGVIGGTMTFVMAIPAGATAQVTPLIVEFPMPIPASAVNTAIVVSAASFGAGNTNAAAVAHGFKI